MAIPALASAQSIRGTVVDRAGAPVPGAVVLLLDRRDSVASRALTSENGAFRVVAASAGTYRLRTLRIGFRPTTSPALTLASGQEITQQFELTGLPFSLDTVRVVSRSSCRSTGDSASVTFAMWEQVRAALTATQLTTGSRGIEATLITYERALDPDRERVQSQGERIVSGVTRAIWSAPSADSLRRAGYVVENFDGSTTFYAPDLRVLLSDQFIEDHCFQLATSKDPTRIGIAFEPSRERRSKAGIRGTLWLERRSAELRQLEFRYTNATREQEYGRSGGNMEFVRVKNGAWVISGWHIRMPVLVQRQARAGGLGSGATVSQLRVDSIRVEGGEVALVTRNRVDTLWARPPMPLVGTVTDSVSGAKLAYARVTLRGTTLAATTDASGRFRIPDALPGQYTAEVRTPTLASFGYIHAIPLAFTDSATDHAIRLPSVTQVVQSLCPGKGARAASGGLEVSQNDGIIAGTVRLAGDTLLPRDVRVIASWNEETARAKRWGGLETRTDARGAFRFCNVPADTRITVATQTDSTNAPPAQVRIPVGARYVVAELTMDPSIVLGGALSGVVLSDVNGQPIPDVEVAIVELSRNVFTSEAGAFRLDEIAPGRRIVTIRRVGYAVKTDTITFAPSRTVDRKWLLSRVATLDTVAVTEWVGPADFEENRKLGLGSFLTRADIDKLQGTPIANRLSELRGVGILRGLQRQTWVIARGVSPGEEGVWCLSVEERRNRGGMPCACYARVYVDKVLMNPPEPQTDRGRITRPTQPFDINTLMTMSIEAAEWYPGPGSVPPQYAGNINNSCGVLVIHTRRGK